MIRHTFAKLSKAAIAAVLGFAATAAIPAAADNIPVYYPGGNTNTGNTNTGGNNAGTNRAPAGNYNAPGALTAASLRGFLTSLGLHPETHQNNNGETTGCDLPFETAKVKGKIMLALSQDQTKLWMVVGVGKIGRGASNAAVLQQFLQYNDATAVTFAMDQDGYVSIKRPVDNVNITRERFQVEVGRLLDAIDTTEPLWMPLLKAAAAESQGQQNSGPNVPPAPGPQNGGDVGIDGRLFPGRK